MFKKIGFIHCTEIGCKWKHFDRGSVGLKVHSLFVNVEVDKKCSLNFRSVLIRICCLLLVRNSILLFFFIFCDKQSKVERYVTLELYLLSFFFFDVLCPF